MGRTARTGGIGAIAALLLLAAPTARADVCVSTNVGAICRPAPGPATSVTAIPGCCILVSAPAIAERSGIQGDGDPATAMLIVYADGHRIATSTVTRDRQDLHLEHQGQTIDLAASAGCCVELTASGPLVLERTGVYGGDAITVWFRGRPVARCAWPAGPSACTTPISAR